VIHTEAHPQAGQTVNVALVQPGNTLAVEFRLEDYWDRIAGKSWMDSDGNPAALQYGMRAGLIGLPVDDEVVYGKVAAFGYLVHVSEISPS
jgi:hypothetical protein